MAKKQNKTKNKTKQNKTKTKTKNKTKQPTNQTNKKQKTKTKQNKTKNPSYMSKGYRQKLKQQRLLSNTMSCHQITIHETMKLITSQ